jgi:hypothetical protein
MGVLNGGFPLYLILLYIMIGKYIDFKVFIISLALGLFLVYLYQPPASVIYVYPTPDNVNTIEYKDKANNCFKFDAIEVMCPSNIDEITNIPMQN